MKRRVFQRAFIQRIGIIANDSIGIQAGCDVSLVFFSGIELYENGQGRHPRVDGAAPTVDAAAPPARQVLGWLRRVCDRGESLHGARSRASGSIGATHAAFGRSVIEGEPSTSDATGLSIARLRRPVCDVSVVVTRTLLRRSRSTMSRTYGESRNSSALQRVADSVAVVWPWVVPACRTAATGCSHVQSTHSGRCSRYGLRKGDWPTLQDSG